MSFRSSVVVAFTLLGAAAFAAAPPLRVCDDPANLPFSNVRQEGFDNTMAKVIARDLGRDIHFIWLPSNTRFVERRLKAGQCDLVMGAPAGYDLMKPTVPVYRSRYVFVSRRDRGLRLHSLRDLRLRTMKIGVHLIEDDFTPPGQELAANGMLPNIVSYTLYGNPLKQDQPANLVHAVADERVDVGVVWGPTAGYFAAHSQVPLAVSPICPSRGAHAVPVAFDISMGVRRDDPALLAQVNRILRRRRAEFQRLLRSYHVPLDDGGACH